MNLPWLPLCAAAIPVLFNIGVIAIHPTHDPEAIALGASVGLLLAFIVLFSVAHLQRRRGPVEPAAVEDPVEELVSY